MTVKRSFKTKRRVSGNMKRFFHPWAKDNGATKVWAEGDYVIGKYLMDITDNYKKECPVLEVLDYSFSTDVLDREKNAVEVIDQNLQLNHCGSLAYAFYGENESGKTSIEHGQIVQVTYMGKITLETGPYAGKPSHQVEVDIMEMDEEGEESNDDLY